MLQLTPSLGASWGSLQAALEGGPKSAASSSSPSSKLSWTECAVLWGGGYRS